MKMSYFISKDEVKAVCRELGLRDWSELTDATVLPEEAAAIRKAVGEEALLVSVERFQKGLEVELEHGTTYADTNVTSNHPILTGKIVTAHLKESLDYYERLDIAEIEGDLLKALTAGDKEKLAAKYRKLVDARLVLAQIEAEALKAK